MPDRNPTIIKMLYVPGEDAFVKNNKINKNKIIYFPFHMVLQYLTR
jgi:hypothetical protein